MKTRDFISRINRIKDKDPKCEVWGDLMDMETADVIEMMGRVDEQLLDKEIEDFKNQTKGG